MSRRALTILSVGALIAVALLWTVPVVGFVACAAVLVAAPPWGRTLTERGIVSVLVVIGLIALAIPRASTVPVTWLSAHIGLTALTLGVVALRFVPRMNTPLPRPTLIDVLIGMLVAGQTLWFVAAYIGRSTTEVLSGLYHTGWDNSGHFIPFANTIADGATLWTTTDGSQAWNQWYPSLHTTLYSLAHLAASSDVALTRPEMLLPYVVWTAVAFALALGALAWMAADLAKRGAAILRPERPWLARVAPVVAVIAFGAFGLLGSPAYMFNAGFTNFVLAVAVMAVSAYISARSWRSARELGWLLVPLAAVAVNGMWTPLVLGLLPAGVVVLIAIARVRRWLAPVWLVVSGVVVGWSVLGQSQAVTPTTGDSGSLLADLGAAAVGMVPFNIGAAFALPVAALLLGIVLIRARRVPLGIAVGLPAVPVAAFALLAWIGAGQAGVPALQSYYVLKVLDGLLIMSAPIVAAAAALVAAEGVHVLKRRIDAHRADSRLVNRTNAALAGVATALVGISVFGFVGPTPPDWQAGFGAAPGIQAGVKRVEATQDSLVGEAILAAQAQAVPYADRTTMLWDGSGSLVNIWLAGVHGVMSAQAQQFYLHLPAFPYDEKTVDYVNFAVSVNPDLQLVVLWFRDVSEAQVAPLAERNPDRVVTVRVPMRSSPLCQECSL